MSLALAVAALALRETTGVPALNPVVVALLLGITLGAGLRAIRGPSSTTALRPGVAFAVRPLLRAAIVLLGLQVTLGALLDLGPGALAVAVAVVALTLPTTVLMGRAMGVDPSLAALIGTGTAICGASAVVAASQVLRGRDGEGSGAAEADVAYALAVITLCGTAALVLWPALATPLGLDDARSYGLWAGASVHEVVQAVGAAAAGGEEAARAGTVMKLARVVLLAPAVVALGWWAASRAGAGGAARARVATPWFAVGFLALVVVNSTGLLSAAASDASRAVVPLMLAASVAALGLSTDLRALRARGAAPLALGVASTLFIAVVAWVGVRLVG